MTGTMKTGKVPFNKPFIVGNELSYVAQAVAQAHLSGDGPFAKRCERWLEERLGCVRAFLTHSCTAALEMSAILCGIVPGDEVILPSFTFVSTANAFVLRGGVPVFVDIRPDTLSINEQLVEEAITPKTRAIIPMHYAGLCCEMSQVLDVAEEYGLIVVEDAAHAMFSKYQGKFLGTLGHLGCLSFHETKTIISGEGGALLVNDERLVARSEIIREKGTDRSRFYRGEVDKYTWVDLGSSYLPGELIAAFLYAQLEQSEKILAARGRIFASYYRLLRPLQDQGQIRLPFLQTEESYYGHLFYIITRSVSERDRLIRFLKGKNISAVFHYVPLHSSPAGVKYGRPQGDLRFTDDISSRLLRLPLYYEMTHQHVERVVEQIFHFYQKHG